MDTQLIGTRVPISQGELNDFCTRWKIAELSLFGSVLRDDFRPDSDIDVLVSFAPDTPHTLFDILELRKELQLLLGREIDIAEKEALRNPFRRHEILATRQVLYAA